MSDDLRRLIADATKLGFAFHGQQLRGGHLQFEHITTGRRITASSTPSDCHAWENARTDMEKMSGLKLPRDNKGKHSFVKVDRADFRPSDTEVKCAEIIDDLVDRAAVVRADFQHLAISPSRANAAKARELLDEYNDIRDELKAFHRIISPIF